MTPILQKILSLFDHISFQTRVSILIGGMLFIVICIIFTLGRYTLADHEFYKNLADRQQLREVELSVNRGTIYGTIDPHRSGSAET